MFGKKKKETNYWMSYADLLTGLAIIFIIICIVVGKKYQATLEQMRAIRAIEQTFEDFDKQSDIFTYDEENKIYQLEVKPEFHKNCSVKLKDSVRTKKDLVAAGEDLQAFVEKMYQKTKISLVIVIEGRAAKHLDGVNMKQNLDWNKRDAKRVKKCSLDRAKYLYDLWNTTTELNNLDFIDLSIAGKGFEGKGRYPYKSKLEEKNKNFVVKIIPIFNPINK